MEINSNVIIVILVLLVAGGIFIYINKNDDQPIPNSGTVNPINPPELSNRKEDDIMGSNIIDDLISQYSVEDRPMDGRFGTFTAVDPYGEKYGKFDNYGHKNQINMRKMEDPFDDSEDYDPRDFSYKKQKFTMRNHKDVEELFDINAMLPQERRTDWFDTEPLDTTRKIKGTHLLHPKVHMGVNTVASTHKNGSQDLRGDIVNPKVPISVFNNSSIEPSTNIKGICSTI